MSASVSYDIEGSHQETARWMASLAAVMLVAARREAMGRFAISGLLRTMGWITTAVMAACVAGMAATA